MMRVGMSQTKTTRAFRTISEAGEELGLQPHVLRFWESKFSDIKPIKRGGGRRFYRPEDIEFIRGIKKLLHDEKHPIKDVQKLIKKKGSSRIVELGRSLEKASREKSVAETDLLPQRIKPAEKSVSAAAKFKPKFIQKVKTPEPEPVPRPVPELTPEPELVAPPVTHVPAPLPEPKASGPTEVDRLALEDALKRLQSIKTRMSDFRNAGVSE